MLRCRVRYFTDGAVIGSKGFVNEIFLSSRQRFSSIRKDGARKLRGSASAANGILWSARDQVCESETAQTAAKQRT
jgi:hypothetical protein